MSRIYIYTDVVAVVPLNEESSDRLRKLLVDMGYSSYKESNGEIQLTDMYELDILGRLTESGLVTSQEKEEMEKSGVSNVTFMGWCGW